MIDRTNKYYLTTAEMLVMRAIWLADHDLVLNEVVRDCNAAYGKDWKPQTVSTYLSHLVQKQFLRMDRNGKIYSYHPIVKAQDYMPQVRKIFENAYLGSDGKNAELTFTED